MFICGCSSDRFATGHGDVGQFIVQYAIGHGGNPDIRSLPAISGRWRYSEDENGVIIRMPREEYPVIEAFLKQTFGEPGLKPDDMSGGNRLGEYRLSEMGGGIQFTRDDRQTLIIILRAPTPKEISKINNAGQWISIIASAAIPCGAPLNFRIDFGAFVPRLLPYGHSRQRLHETPVGR